MKTFTRSKKGRTHTFLFAFLSVNLLLASLTGTAQSGEACFANQNVPGQVWAHAVWTTNPNQTITVRMYLSKNYVDNTYGNNAIGWPGGHTFNQLVGSDNLGWSFKDANGVVRLAFKQDYISASNAFPSGYGTLGFGGDGDSPTVGSASDVVSFKTSLDKNFNDYGYVLTQNSPATDPNYTPNPQYPNWIYDVWYEVTIKQSAFGAAGFGTPSIASVHASPSKTNNSTVIPVPCQSSVGDYVWYDLNGNGIQDSGENGVAGVTVTLNKPDGTTITTTTNASGFYQFTNLSPGNYSVSFPTSLPGGYGLTMSGAGIDESKDSNPNQGSGNTSSISLAPNTTNMTIDAGYVISNLSLGNKVFLDINRNGTYDAATDGNIQNATVKLYQDVNNDNIPDGGPVATTTTNSNGIYGFSSLAPGNYIVGVVMPSPYTITTINGGDPDNDIDNDNNGMTISGGEARGRSISLSSGNEPGNSNINNTYDFGFYNPQTPPDGGGNCFSSANGNPNVGANSYWVYNQSNNTVTIRVVFSKGFVDNTYGTNAVGWPNGHTFSNLTGSDNLTWSILDANGVEKLRFQQDYISSSNAFPSGYGTLGFGGDGNNPTVGNASDVLAFRTSLSENFNSYGYVLTTNSPATDANYSPNPQYPNWIYDVWYEVTVDASAFGAAGFGSVNVASVHASPSKTGNNTEILINTPCNNACIGDRVWNDENKNGIQDAAEVGVAGVVVTLYDENGAIVRSTKTDAYGIYKFCGLETGLNGKNYQVRFTPPPGYIFTTQNADNKGTSGAENSDANPSTGKTGNIMVSGSGSSANITYVDAGIVATASNCIGDFIWNDLDKDGVQDVGEPGIAGVTLTLYNNNGAVIYSTITDNNGHYSFCDLTPGNYSVGISVPPGYQHSPQDAGGNDNTDSDINPSTGKTGTITITTTSNFTIDAGLTTSPTTKAAIGDYVWNDLDGDNLQDANEPGVPNVTVQLYTSANVLVSTTTTDGFGYYIFNDVTPGNYYVKFSNLPSGFIYVSADAGSNDYIDSDVNNVNGSGTTASFPVLADNIYTQYDAGIRNTSILNAIGDFVWYDLDKDGIQDANEPGVPGMTVTLYNSFNGSLIKTTTTNAKGYYLFTDLPSGSYTVGFSNMAAGYDFAPQDQGANDATDSDVNPGTGRTGTINIIGNGNFIYTVDAGIVSNANTFDTKGTIGDFVWNDINNNGIQDAGEPGVQGVTVTLYGADGLTVLSTTTTDALGYYQFANLPAGTYIVGFGGLPAGYSFGTANAGTDDAKDSDADAGTGKTGAISLASGQINTTIDAALRYTGAQSSIGNFVWNDLNGNGHQDVNEPGVPGVSLQLLNSSNAVIASTVSDSKGFYQFTNLSAGTYKIKMNNLPAGFDLTTKDAAPANDATDSDADQTTMMTGSISLPANTSDQTWDFGLRSATTGSIGDFVWNDYNNNGLQDQGEPGVAGVLVTLNDATGQTISSAVTDANGFYLFVNVAPGSYKVAFSGIPASSTFASKDAGSDAADSDANPATGETDVFMLLAGQSNMTIDAGLISKFAGVGDYVWKDINSNGIQDAGEPPMGGITVILYNSANQPVASAITNGNGYYFINNIPVGGACETFTILFTDKPLNSFFTVKHAGGSTTENDSDAGVANGRTDGFILCPGVVRMDIDAGIIPSSPSTLPVSKLDLFVTLENKISKLKWVTLDEVNTDYFVIERSTDGTNFSAVYNKGAAGNFAGESVYFQDDNISMLMQYPVIYYRVKMINLDNSFKYSSIVSVRLSQKNLVTAWPNPFAGEIKVSYLSQGNASVQVRLMDNSGKIVSMNSFQVVNGMNQLSVQGTGSLPAGIYIIEVSNPVSGMKFTQKMVKE
jgi:hypothetical protein